MNPKLTIVVEHAEIARANLVVRFTIENGRSPLVDASTILNARGESVNSSHATYARAVDPLMQEGLVRELRRTFVPALDRACFGGPPFATHDGGRPITFAEMATAALDLAMDGARLRFAEDACVRLYAPPRVGR